VKGIKTANRQLLGSGFQVAAGRGCVKVVNEDGQYLFRRANLKAALEQIGRLQEADRRQWRNRDFPHYAEYADIPEIAPGVFVTPGDAVYIVDDEGEVVTWNADEAAEDGFAFTAALNAVALATKHGAAAVRANIADAGQTLERMILETGGETVIV
jgi:hypothetical protein